MTYSELVSLTGMRVDPINDLVELHGGHMGVENRPSGGASFHFELPIEQKAV